MSLIAIYENGVLRPLEPLDLPDGTMVKLLIVELTDQEQSGTGRLVQSGERLSSKEIAAIFARLAALPHTPHPDGRTDISINHDEILYPKAP